MMYFPSDDHAGAHGNDDGVTAKEAQHRLQTDFLILESDKKRQERLLETVRADIREMNTDIRQMEMLLSQKKEAFARIERDIRLLEEEMKRKKRLLNATTRSNR